MRDYNKSYYSPRLAFYPGIKIKLNHQYNYPCPRPDMTCNNIVNSGDPHMSCISFLLLPEGNTGVATDPTGQFAVKYNVNPEALFNNSFGYATLQKDDPLFLTVVMFAPRPDTIGFCGWKYEGWLVDQPPVELYSSATSVHPEFGGIPHPSLNGSEYPITTGLFRDTGLTIPGGLGVYVNNFSIDQSAWPYDVVVVTFEPPETGTGSMNYDPRPNPLRPITAAIPGRIPKP